LVDIYTRAPGVAGAGTGIVLSSTGEVVTNNHVVAGADTIEAQDVATGRDYPAVVVGADADRDIAVLALRGGALDLPTAPIAGSAGLRVGMAVHAVGNLGGKGGAPTVTAGTITGLDRCVTAHVRPGDSGGPMVSDSGVIGMDVAADSESGFAIPINTVLVVARELGSSDGFAGPGADWPDPLSGRADGGAGLSYDGRGGL
jgi:S1-C subfamily serine protease